MKTKIWLVALVMATACGSTAATGGMDAAEDVATDALQDAAADAAEETDADAATDATSDGECDPQHFDAVDDDCQCQVGWNNHVCIAGKVVCVCDGDVSVFDTAQPDVADTSGTDTSPDTTTAPFSAVQAVFDARCTNCHSATALGLPGYAALPLTSDVSYKNLVNQPAHETCGNVLVAPGKPKESYLWQKLTVDAPCSGSHMPAKFEILPAAPLTAEQLAAIQDWIAAGAQP